MVPAIILLIFVTLQRLAELVWSRSNERRLQSMGAIQAGANHYPIMVGLHGLWLVALWVFGWNQPLVWPWVAVFIVLQLARVWVLGTLGRRWTTRVFVVPGETLVRKGPFRFVSHPNYVVVILEIFALPLAFGLVGVSLVFGIANLLLLAWRVKVENKALATVRG
ncbi:MAG: isoprenylcysteine carboxylmethyltransferase family protein [Caulobacteraceae bacterium]